MEISVVNNVFIVIDMAANIMLARMGKVIVLLLGAFSFLYNFLIEK